ncbi:glycine cleavage system protein GcvH [Streptomyces violascens]|uniref:glycine cleavage system protein GcvH n=1 Tax=Streptomyces violascens TaxID=67381 RepID=UPI001672DD04|nr:glycine cleavage system protein GcvH [Streptomyces violascens]GGU47285.1 glycine cleavage system H protein [Streptomyces violascens]
MSDIPSQLKYTKDHDWIQVNTNGTARTGLTSYAVEQLGDITLVNIDVKPGQRVTAGRAYGTIESVKTLSDIFTPLSGSVVAVNTDLENRPEQVNDEPYGKGWTLEIKFDDASELDSLLTAEAYAELLKTAAH